MLVWLDNGAAELGRRSRAAIDAAYKQGALAVSAISFWEVAMLVEKGRLEIAQDLVTWRRDLLHAGLAELPVDGEAGIMAVGLGGLHADPADRLIVAAASQRGAELVTADQRLLDWRGPVKCRDARR